MPTKFSSPLAGRKEDDRPCERVENCDADCEQQAAVAKDYVRAGCEHNQDPEPRSRTPQVETIILLNRNERANNHTQADQSCPETRMVYPVRHLIGRPEADYQAADYDGQEPECLRNVFNIVPTAARSHNTERLTVETRTLLRRDGDTLDLKS